MEIGDSGRYPETLTLTIPAAAKVEVRAANEHRPTVVLGGDWTISLAPGSELTLNGLLITGGRVRVTAAGPNSLVGVRVEPSELNAVRP